MSGPARTIITGTIYAPDGTLPTGKMLVSTTGTWTSADGFTILQGFTTWVPVADGIFSIALVPNEGSSPASTYHVRIEVTEGYFAQTWDVPSSLSPPSPVGLADVIVP